MAQWCIIATNERIRHAQSGANPRDEAVETSGKRGLTVDDLARMFYEAGFDGVLRADGFRVSLKDYYKT